MDSFKKADSSKVDICENFLFDDFRWIEMFSAMGLPSGSLLTIGGGDKKTGQRLNEIWELKNDKWSEVGSLSEVR